MYNCKCHYNCSKLHNTCYYIVYIDISNRYNYTKIIITKKKNYTNFFKEMLVMTKKKLRR